MAKKARSIWNGTVAFGTVAVPIKLFSAVEDRSVHFREVHAKDGAPIEHRRVNPKTGREVPYERIAKAYQSGRGKQVLLTDEEIAAAKGSRPKVIEIEHFVCLDEIDPVFFDRMYHLGAQEGGERAYRVLVAALERSGKAGIGRFVLRTREQLVALRPRDGALALHTMRFADEVVDRKDLEPPALRRKPTAKEVEMAGRLVETLQNKWKPDAHRDEHREALLALIERKAQGEEIELPPEPETTDASDLLAALEASLDKRHGGRKRSGASKPSKRARSRGSR